MRTALDSCRSLRQEVESAAGNTRHEPGVQRQPAATTLTGANSKKYLAGLQPLFVLVASYCTLSAQMETNFPSLSLVPGRSAVS